MISYEFVLGKILKNVSDWVGHLEFQITLEGKKLLEDIQVNISGRPGNLTYSSSEEEVDNIATKTVILNI